MELKDETRGFFNLRALEGEMESRGRMGESGLVHRDMSGIAANLQTAINNPSQAYEIEDRIECALRNNGYDPNHDKGWEFAGLKGKRLEAVRLLKQAYLNTVPDGMKHLKNLLTDEDEHDRDYYTPSALREDNLLVNLLASFKRAHFYDHPRELFSDKSWQKVGFENISAFQTAVRELFVDAKIGERVADELNDHHDPHQTYDHDDLSRKAADYAIQHAFPELAEKLRIPADIKDGLVKKPNIAGQDFRQATIQPTDFRPD